MQQLCYWFHRASSRDDVIQRWGHPEMMSSRDDVIQRWGHPEMRSSRDEVIQRWGHPGRCAPFIRTSEAPVLGEATPPGALTDAVIGCRWCTSARCSPTWCWSASWSGPCCSRGPGMESVTCSPPRWGALIVMISLWSYCVVRPVLYTENGLT